jgi:hypothetical protein
MGFAAAKECVRAHVARACFIGCVRIAAYVGAALLPVSSWPGPAAV